MPHTLLLCINPDCLDFLKQAQSDFGGTTAEIFREDSDSLDTFIDSINALHNTVEQLKSQAREFTSEQKSEISRGAFYALTKSLEKKITEKQPITLADLQNVMNKDFKIEGEAANFIIMALLEPNSLPLALSIPLHSFLPKRYYWSNECTDLKFQYTLKAKEDPSKESVVFNMMLVLKTPDDSPTLRGSAHIQFTVDKQEQIKLNPLNIEFNFIDEKEFRAFKQELCSAFQDWIFLLKTHWQTTDVWVIPILLGCFVGLIAMISLIALSLTPFSPLLLPPLGLALGLGLSSFIHTCVHMNIKRDQEKLKRPILFNTSGVPIHHQNRQATSDETRRERSSQSRSPR
jgi:hypothetical protein